MSLSPHTPGNADRTAESGPRPSCCVAVDAADVDRINEDLAGLMPAGVNKEVKEVVDTRNDIGNRYGLTDPEEFGND